jgi:hypothetical protein
MDWRVAAALTLATLGGLSVVLSQRQQGGKDDRTPAATTAETTMLAQQPGRPTSDTPASTANPRTPATATRVEKAELSFGGGVDDLDTASLEALMGALDEIERAPVAPSAEPGRVTVLPSIGDDT